MVNFGDHGAEHTASTQTSGLPYYMDFYQINSVCHHLSLAFSGQLFVLATAEQYNLIPTTSE